MAANLFPDIFRLKHQKLSAPAILTRNAKIVAYARSNPCATLESMGYHYGVTREYIRQILKRAGVRQDSRTAQRLARPVRLCVVCQKPLFSKASKRHIYCTAVMEVPCVQCGQLVTRSIAVYKQAIQVGNSKGRVFCNRKCCAQWNRSKTLKERITA